LAQECFLRAYRGRAEFRGEASPTTWLVRIAVNLARDHIRSRRAGFWRRLFANGGEEAEAAAAGMVDWRPTPEQALATNQRVAAVWQAAGALPQQQRTVFVLRFVEEMSLDEIAMTTGLRVGTVKAHLFRALASVRARVEPGAGAI
jgi:RNA polymerase sigma-70 factor (ECF subfamily)